MVNSSLYNSFYNSFYNGGQHGGSKIKSTFSNFSSLLNSKKDLMIMIFANLITQLGITYYVMTNTKVTKDDKNNLKWIERRSFELRILKIKILSSLDKCIKCRWYTYEPSY